KLSQLDSDLAKKVKSIIEAGHLVPNDVVMEIVENFLKSIPANTNVLFDGIPRKVEQANSLNSLLDKNGRTYKAVLLDIKEETAMKRLTTRRICKICKAVYPATYTADKCNCGGELITSSDDNPEAIITRLKAFREETIPAINLYKDKLIKIDGEPDIEEVQKLAFQTLGPIMR
ncbi:MAG: nucleoside monophosphate kinase, partial [Patescibacteria group bacterium]